MFRNSDVTNVTRRRFLTVAGTVAATSSFSVGKDSSLSQTVPAPTPVKYLVTIDVRSGSISYSVSPTIDPHIMKVNVNDEITWQVKSAGSHPKHHAAVLFIATTPFLDTNGQPATTFQWSDSDDANIGVGGGKTQTKGTHEYCVAVFDKAKGKLYLDDPKIIVGGTVDAKGQIVEAESELRAVRAKIESIENALRTAIPKL
jgi:hypothetical protein